MDDDPEDSRDPVGGISSDPASHTKTSLNVQNLIVISSDPSPEVSRKRPLSASKSLGAETDDLEIIEAVQEAIVLSDDEDEDQVTDYLEKLNVEVPDQNSEGGTATSSEGASASEISPRDSDGPMSPMITTRLAVNEQDTISDESGYSEESNPSNKDHGINLDIEENGLNLDLDQMDDDFDLTVKGVLISDFSPSERLKYLQRSQSTSSRTYPRGHNVVSQNQPQSLQPPQKLEELSVDSASECPPKDLFQNKMPEFCINI